MIIKTARKFKQKENVFAGQRGLIISQLPAAGNGLQEPKICLRKNPAKQCVTYDEGQPLFAQKRIP
jgi:hypothetical protein